MDKFSRRVNWFMYHIPEGNVISYGGLAALAGNASLSRQVGQLAHFGDSRLPWHRLIYSDGHLAESFPVESLDRQRYC